MDRKSSEDSLQFTFGDRNPSFNEESPSKRRTETFDLMVVMVVALSFLAGVTIAIAMFNPDAADETATSVEETQETTVARVVVDAGPAAEVAGVVCDDPGSAVSTTSSPADTVVAWNTTVQSTGNECTPPLRESLGPAWVMTETTVAIFGEAGSLYEFSAGETGVINGLSMFFVGEDGAEEREGLTLAIETIWGDQNVDWERTCADTDRDWVGAFDAERATLSVTRCNPV